MIRFWLRSATYKKLMQRHVRDEGFLNDLTTEPLRHLTRDFVAYMETCSHPSTESEIRVFETKFDAIRDASSIPARCVALTFLDRYALPWIPLIDVTTQCVQETALSLIVDLDILVNEPTSLHLIPSEGFFMPDGTIVPLLPRTRREVDELIRTLSREKRAEIREYLLPDKASGRPAEDLRHDVEVYLRIKLQGDTAYRIASESQPGHVDTNKITRGFERVTELLGIPRESP